MAEDARDSVGPLPAPIAGEGDDGGVARINLRLPEHLKARVDEAATRDGLSVNSWLVRATSAALGADVVAPAAPAASVPRFPAPHGLGPLTPF